MLKSISNISICMCLGMLSIYAAHTESPDLSEIQSNVLYLKNNYKIDLQERCVGDEDLEELAGNLLTRFQQRPIADQFFYVSGMQKFCALKNPKCEYQAIDYLKEILDMIDNMENVDIKSFFRLTDTLYQLRAKTSDLNNLLELIAASKDDQQQHIVNMIIDLVPYDAPGHYFILLGALLKFDTINERNEAVRLSVPYFHKINNDLGMGQIITFVSLNQNHRDEIVDILSRNVDFLHEFDVNEDIEPFSDREFLRIRPFLSMLNDQKELDAIRDFFNEFNEDEMNDPAKWLKDTIENEPGDNDDEKFANFMHKIFYEVEDDIIDMYRKKRSSDLDLNASGSSPLKRRRTSSDSN